MAQLSAIESSSRVRTAVAYPIKQFNVAPVILATEFGLTVHWNSTSQNPASSTQHTPVQCSIGTPILDIAVPHISPVEDPAFIPSVFKDSLFVAAACADSTIKIITIPYTADTTNVQAKIISEFHNQHGIADLITLTWSLESDDDTAGAPSTDSESSDVQILIASTSKNTPSYLWFHQMMVGKQTVKVVSKPRLPRSILLPSAPIRISFSTASYTTGRNEQILIACGNGMAYVYDPFYEAIEGKPLNPDQDIGPDNPVRIRWVGRWLGSFSSRFTHREDEVEIAPGLTTRKRLLDAKWAIDSTAIVAILADGEWGVWDVDGSRSTSKTSSGSSFALWGMLGSGIPSHISRPQETRKSLEPSTFLPTMTPNTRRFKAESLFSGHMTSTSSHSYGGLIVAEQPLPSADNVEDIVYFWFNDTICYLDSLQAYWARAAKRSEDSKLGAGSLFGPALTRINGVDVCGMRIAAVSQLPVDADQAETSRTVAIATDHRLQFVSRTPPRVAGSLIKTLPERIRPVSNEAQNSLFGQSAELDVGAMDAILDQMDASSGDLQMTGALPAP
ncbi:hypothetical protein BT63DRAFT_322811 [Microthyrium microscopicum]|uniref:Nucleoporin NUP37 n=1 Tax=Microthyrium microscopicum TaxID=703497 RepID=A0A6A6U7F1_9PEZI|nr:hypothetical protein BT63DRAFT_322811 [Microthyrium microscopicum]